MREGEYIRGFKARNGSEVTLRYPKWADLDGFLEFINALVEEGADIVIDSKKTRDEEIDWLAQLLSNMEKEKMVNIVAEVDGKLVGHVGIGMKQGYSRHVWQLGISVTKEYRDIGVGQELMKEAEVQAAKLEAEMIQLNVYERNHRAIHVYKKRGYTVVGRIPGDIKRDGVYLDTLVMVKTLNSERPR